MKQSWRDTQEAGRYYMWTCRSESKIGCHLLCMYLDYNRPKNVFLQPPCYILLPYSMKLLCFCLVHESSVSMIRLCCGCLVDRGTRGCQLYTLSLTPFQCRHAGRNLFCSRQLSMWVCKGNGSSLLESKAGTAFSYMARRA